MIRVLSNWREGVCYRCGCKDVLTVWRVRPRSGHHETYRFPGVTIFISSYTSCASRAKCDARLAKRRERSRTRGSLLILQQPKAPGAPRATCRWCGDPIVRPDGQPDRRRNYHHGPARGEPDCAHESDRSRTWDPRIALERMAEIAGEPLRCADCGVELDGDPAVWSHVSWDADHEIPLEDGGEHSLENLRARCCPCHKAKTAREATARAAARATPYGVAPARS